MAGNARFHDKLHRKNHHTNPTVGFADSASDPIASPSEPFQGDFIVNGQLSSNKGISLLSASIAGDIYCNNIHVSSVTYTNYISGNSTQVIISDKESVGFGNNTLNLDFKTAIYNRVNNNTVMYVASSNIGIMTESPRSTVDILGNTFIQATNVVIGDTGLLTLIKPSSTYNTNDLEIKTYGSWANGINATGGGLKIKSAGGTFTSPTQTLSGRLGYIIGSSTHNGNIWKNSSAINFGLEENALIDNQPSYISFETLSSGANLTSSRQEAMRINSVGNVGIGTTTPNQKLTVNGSISATNLFVNSSIVVGNSTDTNTNSPSATLRFVSSNGKNYIESGETLSHNSSAALIFTTMFADTEWARFDKKGYFGIGESSPWSKLHVKSEYSNAVPGGLGITPLMINNSAVDYPWVRFGVSMFNGDYNPITQTGDQAIIFSGQSTKSDSISANLVIAPHSSVSNGMRITYDGRVGIGVAIPEVNFHVRGKNSAMLLETDASSQECSMDFRCNSTGGRQWRLGTGGSGGGYQNGSIGFYDVTSDSMKMLITSGGNVGIGTDSPWSKLHVAGGLTLNAENLPSGIGLGGGVDASNLSGVYIQFNTAGTGSDWAYLRQIGTPDSFHLSLDLHDNGNTNLYGEAFSIRKVQSTLNPDGIKTSFTVDNSGHVGIGTSTPNDSLQVADSGGGSLNITRPGGWGGGITTWDVYAGGTIGTGSANGLLSATVASTGAFWGGSISLYTDSASKPGTNTWSILSDERVKENIRPFTKGLSALVLINPVVYDYNGKAKISKIKDNVGVIAQDIRDIVPEGVSTYLTKLEDSDEEDTELMNFNSHSLTYIMINAIKELNTKIEAQAAEIAVLKSSK